MDEQQIAFGLNEIADWVGDQQPPTPELLDARCAQHPRDVPHRAWVLPALSAAAVVAVVVGIVVINDRPSGHSVVSTNDTVVAPTNDTVVAPINDTVLAPTNDSVPATEPPVGDGVETVNPLAPAPDWKKVATSPLSPRNGSFGVWTGEEVLVLGGTETPMCATCDYAITPIQLRDAAAYNPTTDSWRMIVDSPLESVAYLRGVVVGNEVVVLGMVPAEERQRLWAYSIPGDVWREIELPAQAAGGYANIVAHGEVVILYSGSDERGETGDLVLRPASGEWTPLPDDPFESMFDRTMVSVDGRLLLFARVVSEVYANQGPVLVHGAVLDETTGTWAELPVSDQTTPPTFVEGQVAISPYRGGSDGGEVNGYGRVVPHGGAFDLAANEWRALPGEPDGSGYSGGVVGQTSALFTAASGDVLDTLTWNWHAIPDFPGVEDQYYRDGKLLVGAGTDLFVFGGFDQEGVHNEGYLWDTGR